MPAKSKKSERKMLSHHSHTAKLLPRSSTSWPLLTALLLMVGVLLLTTTLKVRADTVNINAIVYGQPPPEPAVILSPPNNRFITLAPIPVSGTCPVGYFVKLYRNDIFSGATPCFDNGTFVINTDLFSGRNDLNARIFNISDIEGPKSPIVSVYYNAPAPGGPVYIVTDYFYKAAFTGQDIQWDFEVKGGMGPFTAKVVWGDGYNDIFTQQGRIFNPKHEYKVLRTERDYFTVAIEITDTNGQKATLQLVAIMNDDRVIGFGQTKPEPPLSTTYGSWLMGRLKYVWSMYGFVLLMGLCFYLGERRGSSVTAAFYRRRRQSA